MLIVDFPDRSSKATIPRAAPQASRSVRFFGAASLCPIWARRLALLVFFLLAGPEAQAQRLGGDSAKPPVGAGSSSAPAAQAKLAPLTGLAQMSDQILSDTSSDRSGASFDELAQRLREAFRQSPVPDKLQRAVQVGEARLEEANAAFLPRLTTNLGVGRTNYGTSGSPAGQGDRSINASQLVYDFGLSPALLRSANHRLVASVMGARVEESKLALAMVLAALEWQRAAQSLQIAQAFVATRNQFAEFTAERVREGVSSPFDLQRARAKVLEAADEVPAALKRLQAAQTRYSELLGRSRSEPILPARFELPLDRVAGAAGAQPGDLRAQEAAILPDSPRQLSSYLETQANAAALEQDLLAERARRWGGFNLEAGYGLSDQGSSFERERTSAVVVYRSELLSGFIQRARIRQAAARMEESRFELERLERELAARSETARLEWEASERIQLARRELVLETRRTEELTRELFLFGRASLSDLFRAQEDFVTASQKLGAASFDRQQAWYQWVFQRDLILDLFGIRTR